MIDEIVESRLQKKCKQLIADLQKKEAVICALASAHHPNSESCVVFDQKRGSYNYCFFVQFNPSGTRWVVRIPIAPRLAFVEEKLEAEVATMRYIASETTIPIPSIHAYSLHGSNPIGLPYLIMDYKEGRTLQDVGLDNLSEKQKSHLLDQVADVLLQLRKQEFPRIGSLSLETLGVANRPLSIEANGQEMEGLDVSSIWKPSRVYESARDYCDSVVALAMNDFAKARYAVYDQDDAEEMLYYLDGFRRLLPTWLDPSLDKGPFVLAHGDFRPANLLVHPESLDLVAVLDWEWSGVVPLQMFTPPTWLTWRELGGLCRSGWYEGYVLELESFLDRVARRESVLRLAGAEAPSLSREWEPISRMGRFLVAAALNSPGKISTVYAFIDGRFLRHTEDLTTRVARFLNGEASRRVLVKKKVRQMRAYKAELWFRNQLEYLATARYPFVMAIMLGSAAIFFGGSRFIKLASHDCPVH